ncbi:hypothetical protein Ddc_13165 [Ditylenchus destructor]|nr:hypothetical protein Ddc_13165 [Ditylenchus destructor]
MRSGIQPPLPTGPQTPSSSKILPPPPPPPTLTPESGSEAATAKRRIEESPDATLAKKVVKTETRERIHVMKKPDPVVSPKQEVVVDEWVAQASVLNMKDEPRKEKKKLALSEYRERRKEAASAFSNEVHSASSAEHHLSDGTTSETEQSAGSSASITVKVEIKTEVEKTPELPRRSFIPDMNTASELVESMELPIGIPMVKTEVKKEKSGSDKEREKRKREEDSSRRRRHEEKHSRDSSQHSRDASSHQHKSSSRPPSNLNQTLPAQQGQKYEKLAKPTMPQATGSSQPQPQPYRSLTPNMPSGQMASGQKTVPQTSGLSQPMRELSSGYNQAATRPQPQVQQTGWSSPPSPVFESISPSDSPAVPRPPVPQAHSQTRMPLPAASSSMSAQSNSWRPAKPYKQSQSQQSSQRSSQNSAGGQELEEGELD